MFVGIGAVAASLRNSLFLFCNFTYIGLCISVGIVLYQRKWRYTRNFVQLGVGGYLFVYVGLILRENLQLSGFFFYLFLGTFQAATIHHAVAKIIGPLFFGRGWCGYACWTAMILDLLPFKTPVSHERVPRLGLIRYAIFAATFLFVVLLFVFVEECFRLERTMFVMFIAGNALYYVAGIFLAYRFKDNRAFCKYACPVVAFLKPASYFSFLRMRKDDAKCVGCGKCLAVCPMDVDMLDNSRARKNGTECILCGECWKVCPHDALRKW
jgi:polyferredoxin